MNHLIHFIKNISYYKNIFNYSINNNSKNSNKNISNNIQISKNKNTFMHDNQILSKSFSQANFFKNPKEGK